MKRNFLLMLLLTLLPFAGWAAGPTLQGLTPITEDLDVWVITDGTTLPGASDGTVTFYDAQSKQVTAITKVGWYCAKIKVGDTYTAIPFQAWKAVDFDVIDDQVSFEESRDNGVMGMYYSDPNYVTTDDKDGEGVAQWIIAAANGELYDGDNPATYGARKHKNGVGYPYIVFASTEAYPCQVRFVYSEGSGTEIETEVYNPWESFYTRETPVFFSTTDKTYGIASANEELHTGQVYAYMQDDEVLTNDDENELDEEALAVYWTPQNNDAPDFFVYDWKLSQSTLPYNSENQYNALRGLISFIPELGGLGDNGDWSFTVKMGENAGGTAVTEVKDVGSYFVQVYMGGDNADQFEIGTGKVFKITAYNLTIGSSVTYKQIGDPDPTPEYGLMYDNNVSTEAANLTITGLKLVRKFAPSLNRVSTVADDYVGAQWDYYIDIRDAQIVDANGDVNPNYAISSASVEGTLEVTKKYLRPGEFRVTVDAEYTYDGSAKEPAASAITVEQDKNYDKRGEADYTAAWTAVQLDGNFDISYFNNINADAYGTNSGTEADPVYAWMNDELVINKDANLLITGANRAIVVLTPTANGIYTSRLALGNNKFLPANEADQVKQIAGDFKIKQRDIATATIAEIDDVIFSNAAQTPRPNVTYGNMVLVEKDDVPTEADPTAYDFVYSYKDNTYVTEDAKCAIIAKFVLTDEERVYSGNWYGEKEEVFTINPFVFTLLPLDGEKPYLDPDPNWDDEDWAKTQLVARPSADMVDASGAALTFPVTDVSTLLKDGWSISRAVGEFIAVYDININNAELYESNPADVSDPAHNYVMTVETGAFEIKKAALYYASSKYVTREFRSQDSSIPFIDSKNNTDGNAFYLYRRTVEDDEVTYVQIPETDDLYKEIKASGRITGNQLVGQTIDGSVQTVLNGNEIEPIVDNGEEEGEYEYTIGILPRNAFQHTTGDYAETPEGICFITPRKVTIMADNQTSAFGEAYVTPLTYKVYDGHVERETLDKQESNVSLVTNGAYAANTIARFNGLTCGIAAAVNAAEKPLTANVTADIVVSTAASNGGTLAQRNPNYDIKFVDGTYTVTPSTNQYFVDVQLNKDYDGTTGNWNKTVTWTFGTSKDTAEPIDGDKPVTDEEIVVNWGDAGEPTDVGETTLTSEMITRPNNANIIGGYPVNYGGKATISVAGEVVITVKNLGAQYPVPPTLSFDNKRVSVTGATFDEIAANGDFVLTYTKPEVGFIKKGATVQVEFNGKAFGTPEGEVVSADDWAWVANYTKVTVKSGKVMVTAPDVITIDIAAFNKASYLESFERDAEINDELIRDYAGTEVETVNIICSAQTYTVKGNQWYSMVLPFEATVREIQEIFNGFVGVEQLQTLHAASKASEITFTYSTKNVPANNPFIAKTDRDFEFGTVTINRGLDSRILIEYPENEDGTPGELAVEDANGNKFIGTYNAFFADNQTDYCLVNLSAGNYQAMGNDAYVRPLGAYFKVAPGVPNNEVRIFIEEPDGTITAINGVNAETMSTEGVYNLSGQRVSRAQKGIFIKDGKKVLVK